MSDEKRDPWLTEKEAAKELRVSAYTVRLEREAGRLGFAKLRRRVFYPMSLIEAYRQSITCPAKSNSGDTLTASATTSPGPLARGPTAFQRAQRTLEKLRSSGRLGS
jgi:hypothetical protein